MSNHLPITLLLLAFFSISVHSQIKREREESPPGIEASNTMGFSNIWLHGYTRFIYRENSGFSIEPYGKGGLGLSNNLSAWGGAVVLENGIKKLVGKADAHLKATLPYNDNLRFFGFGIQCDLILSSDQDTFTITTDSTRPAYTPRLGVTAIADFDIIKIVKKLPLKIFINFSTIEDDRLLPEWKQQSYRFAAEWKNEKSSYYAGTSLGIFAKRNPAKSNKSLNATLLSLMGGAKLRPFDILALSATAKVSLPIEGNGDFIRYAFSIGAEVPLFFRETNAEAIRSMILMENSKPIKSAQQTVKRAPTTLESLFTDNIDDNNAITSDTSTDNNELDEKERIIRERRKNINEELKDIERLLE